MTRADRLWAFIESTLNEPITFAVNDCTASCANWIEAETGFKPVLPYRTKNQAMAMMQRRGLVSLWDEALEGRFEPVSVPTLGDVGIVETEDRGDVGVIFASGGFCFWRRELTVPNSGWRWFSPKPIMIRKVWAI